MSDIQASSEHIEFINPFMQQKQSNKSSQKRTLNELIFTPQQLSEQLFEYYVKVKDGNLLSINNNISRQFIKTQKKIIQIVEFRKDLQKNIQLSVMNDVHSQFIKEICEDVVQKQETIDNLSVRIKQIKDEFLDEKISLMKEYQQKCYKISLKDKDSYSGELLIGLNELKSTINKVTSRTVMEEGDDLIGNSHGSYDQIYYDNQNMKRNREWFEEGESQTPLWKKYQVIKFQQDRNQEAQKESINRLNYENELNYELDDEINGLNYENRNRKDERQYNINGNQLNLSDIEEEQREKLKLMKIINTIKYKEITLKEEMNEEQQRYREEYLQSNRELVSELIQDKIQSMKTNERLFQNEWKCYRQQIDQIFQGKQKYERSKNDLFQIYQKELLQGQKELLQGQNELLQRDKQYQSSLLKYQEINTNLEQECLHFKVLEAKFHQSTQIQIQQLKIARENNQQILTQKIKLQQKLKASHNQIQKLIKMHQIKQKQIKINNLEVKHELQKQKKLLQVQIQKLNIEKQSLKIKESESSLKAMNLQNILNKIQTQLNQKQIFLNDQSIQKKGLEQKCISFQKQIINFQQKISTLQQQLTNNFINFNDEKHKYEIILEDKDNQMLKNDERIKQLLVQLKKRQNIQNYLLNEKAKLQLEIQIFREKYYLKEKQLAEALKFSEFEQLKSELKKQLLRSQQQKMLLIEQFAERLNDLY